MKQLFSVLFLWSISLSASADTGPAVLRSPPDAANAKLVISSLRQAKITLDNPLFSEFNDLAFDAMHNKNYTSAIKFFSENMLRYPSPQMIINYTDANLMMLTDNKNTLAAAPLPVRIYKQHCVITIPLCSLIILLIYYPVMKEKSD